MRVSHHPQINPSVSAGTIKSSVLAQELSNARVQAAIAQLAQAADDKLGPLRLEISRLKETQQAMASTKPAARLLKKVGPCSCC